MGQPNPLLPINKVLDQEAERIAKELVRRKTRQLREARRIADNPEVSIKPKTIRKHTSRSVGVKQVGLWALQELELPALLLRLGFTRGQCNAAVASIIGRLASPASEWATYAWLCGNSGLEEFLKTRFANSSVMQLYRASDLLVKHRQKIEQHVYSQTLTLFDTACTMTLLDLTNSYLEGSAKRGHAKEKRSDGPLVTLALVLDGSSGFVQRSQIFDGNVREDTTLAQMLADLDAPEGVVVMDRGVVGRAGVSLPGRPSQAETGV